MVRKNGLWGRLCVENLDKNYAKAALDWTVLDLGYAVCKYLTFQ